MIETWKKVVFFGAHTDDEMICAGTLHRLSQHGTEVHVVTFGPAAIETDRTGSLNSLDVVCQEWVKSLKLIGADLNNSRLYEMTPSSRLHEKGQEICQRTFDHCERHKPDAAFILSSEDENPAHAEVGRQCERVMRGRVPHVIRCQFPWNYGIGRPNLFVSLSQGDVETKEDVILTYESQAFRYDYRTMLMSYARADGLSVKTEWAEKFELIRSVV